MDTLFNFDLADVLDDASVRRIFIFGLPSDVGAGVKLFTSLKKYSKFKCTTNLVCKLVYRGRMKRYKNYMINKTTSYTNTPHVFVHTAQYSICRCLIKPELDPCLDNFECFCIGELVNFSIFLGAGGVTFLSFLSRQKGRVRGAICLNYK